MRPLPENSECGSGAPPPLVFHLTHGLGGLVPLSLIVLHVIVFHVFESLKGIPNIMGLRLVAGGLTTLSVTHAHVLLQCPMSGSMCICFVARA